MKGIDERQASKFAKEIKKAFKPHVDAYVRKCFESAREATTPDGMREESTRIMMRAAMLAYMRAGMRMKQEEIQRLIWTRQMEHYFSEPFKFIDYNKFNEQVYWYWVQAKVAAFMQPLQEAWKE